MKAVIGNVGGAAARALSLLLAANLAVGPARAAVFTVDTIGAGADANLEDGLCLAIGGGCTYEAASQQTNAFPDEDTIQFAFTGPGPHVISDAGDGFAPFVSPVHVRCDTQVGYTPCVATDCSGASWPVIFDRQGRTERGLEFDSPGSSIVGCSVHNVAGSTTSGYGIHLGIAATGSFAIGNEVANCWGGIVSQAPGGKVGDYGVGDANYAHHNHFGLTVLGGGGVINSVSEANESNGVYVEGGRGNLVDGVQTFGNGGPGIFVKLDSVDTIIRNSTIGMPVCNTGRGMQDQGVNTDASVNNTFGNCAPAPWCADVSGLGETTCLSEVDFGKHRTEAEFLADIDGIATPVAGSYREGGRCQNVQGTPVADGSGSCVGPSMESSPTEAPSATQTPTPTEIPTATSTRAATETETPTATPTATLKSFERSHPRTSAPRITAKSPLPTIPR